VRREHLRNYFISALAEGVFSSKTKALKTFIEDVSVTVTEIGQMSAEAQGSRLGAAVLEKVRDVIGEVAERGLRAVWGDIRSQYERGMDNQARIRSERR